MIHCDETGGRMDGDNWWKWVFYTLNTVQHVICFNRNVDVIHEIIGLSQADVWVSDC